MDNSDYRRRWTNNLPFEDKGKVYHIANDENNNPIILSVTPDQRAVIMAIDLTGAEERKARAAGTQPAGKLTLEDLKKDPSVMQTIRRYSYDRYGTDYVDPDEALEDFLSEYRGIQNNTMNALPLLTMRLRLRMRIIKHS
jgi:hypothetical protein